MVLRRLGLPAQDPSRRTGHLRSAGDDSADFWKADPSKLNAFDLVVTVSLGSVLGAVLVNASISVAEGVVAIAVLVLSQFAVTLLSVRWSSFEGFVKAEPSVVLEGGIPRTGEMRSVRLTRRELQAAMRAAGVTAEEQVQAITLETDGSLTVVKRSSEH